MRLSLKLNDEAYQMDVVNERQQIVQIDGAEAIGGKDSAYRPMELVAAGLVGCSSIDVLSILRKKRKTIDDFHVEVDAKRVDTIPGVFETIHLTFHLKTDASASDVEQALALTFEKYCSVSRMLEKTAKITYSYFLES
jgi:putative redox protein